MSGHALGWAFAQDLPCAHKFVLVALADNAGHDGTCWPSQRNIAEKCGLSRQRVNEILGDLELSGHLTISGRQRKNGADSSCFYTLATHPEDETPRVPVDVAGHLYVIADGDRCKIGISRDASRRIQSLETSVGRELATVGMFPCPMSVARKVEQISHEKFHDVRLLGEWFEIDADVASAFVSSALRDFQVSSSTTGGVSQDDTGVSPEKTRVSTEPSISNPKLKQTPSSKKSSTTDFEQFYQAYPKKVGRRAAETAYGAARRRGATAEAILSGAARYATGTAGTDRQYVKHPSTWLNGDHWRDGEELAQPTVTDARDLTAEQWTEELRMFVRYGQWKTANGPSPLFGGCLAPAELLVKAKAFWEQNGNRPVDDVLQAFRKPVEFHPAGAVQLRQVGGS